MNLLQTKLRPNLRNLIQFFLPVLDPLVQGVPEKLELGKEAVKQVSYSLIVPILPFEKGLHSLLIHLYQRTLGPNSLGWPEIMLSHPT